MQRPKIELSQEEMDALRATKPVLLGMRFTFYWHFPAALRFMERYPDRVSPAKQAVLREAEAILKRVKWSPMHLGSVLRIARVK